MDGLFLGQRQPLESVPVIPFVLAAVLAVAMVHRLGEGAPATERVAVGALTVAALVAAIYPGMLRFNAATAEPWVIGYEVVAPGRFQDPSGRFPEVDLSGKDLDEYWAEHPEGSVHEFRLFRGSAGFVQLDLRPLYEKTRAFYRQRE
ncbi:MAG: hypothetical protein U5L11_17155 [Arhodomonas sp.]|nr:hypothetical protein [Arhodomonas sp.]